MQLVPPVMVLLAKSPLLDKYDLSCVEGIIAGAAPVSAELEEEVRERFGGRVIVRQGLKSNLFHIYSGFAAYLESDKL